MAILECRGLTKEGKWVYGYAIERLDNLPLKTRTWIIPLKMGLRFFPDRTEVMDTIEVIPETVGQFTGLKDKNGKDLDWWEDDLLRKGSDHPCAPISRIIYDTQKAQWVVVGRSGSEFCGLLQAYLNDWKKIGNIHQNPNL